MKISQVKKVKNGTYEIVVDEEKSFKVSEDFLIKYHLYNNKEINEEDFKLLNTLSNQSKIYTKVLNYISFKMRTEDEVITYLKDKGCIEPYLQETMDKLKRLNYVNDALYAESFVKQQFNINKKGPYYIRTELLKKKVNETIVDKSIAWITPDKIKENVFSLIKYYDKLNKNKSIQKLKETILRNLLSKGYQYESVYDVLNDYQFKKNNDDRDLLEKEFHKVLTKYQKKYKDLELKSRVIKALMNKGFLYEDIQNLFVSMNTEG